MSLSQREKQESWVKATDKFVNGIKAGIRSAFIARVIKYNSKEHLADIQPLNNISDGQERAQLLDVPVAEQCYLLDEMVDALKPEFAKQDKNNALPEHTSTSFTSKLPKKHFMRAGVPVIAVILDRDLDNWGGGRSIKTFKPNSSRMHNINDSIVIGVLGGNWLDG